MSTDINKFNLPQEMDNTWKIYTKDGKYYKKTKDRQGNSKLCEVSKCGCGGWASVKLLNHESHTKTRRHRDWVKKTTPPVPPPTLKDQITHAKEQIKEFEFTIKFAQEQLKKWQIEYCELLEKQMAHSSDEQEGSG